MLEKLKRLAYRHTNGMFGLYLKHSAFKSALASMVVELAFVFTHLFVLVLSGMFLYLTILLVYALVVANYGEFVVWGIVLGFGAVCFIVFTLAWVLFYRILRVCTDYETACLKAARTEGPPKPFNLDCY